MDVVPRQKQFKVGGGAGYEFTLTRVTLKGAPPGFETLRPQPNDLKNCFFKFFLSPPFEFFQLSRGSLRRGGHHRHQRGAVGAHQVGDGHEAGRGSHSHQHELRPNERIKYPTPAFALSSVSAHGTGRRLDRANHVTVRVCCSRPQPP